MELQLKMVLGVYGTPWFPVADLVLLIFKVRSIQTGRLCSPVWMDPRLQADKRGCLRRILSAQLLSLPLWHLYSASGSAPRSCL